MTTLPRADIRPGSLLAEGFVIVATIIALALRRQRRQPQGA